MKGSSVSGLKLRMKSILDAIEIDLHRALMEQVAPIVTVRMLVGHHYDKVAERASRAAFDEERFPDFLDTGDLLELLNTHRVRLDEETAAGLRTINAHVEGLLPIRNRVAHAIRSLEPTDHEEVLRVAGIVQSSTFPCHELTKAMRDNDYRPDARVTATSSEPDEFALHNLPRPEFDDTGLIGRAAEKRELVEHLMGRRDSVYTLVGSGGLGKTALAIAALTDVLLSPDCPYDLILWTSLKTERLTGEGIQEIASSLDAVSNLETGVHELFEDSGGGLDWISASLDGLTTLVVIDNFETTDTDEFLAVYDNLPRDCTYLITSREGIGQLERLIPVEPLQDKSAARLMRVLAQIYDLDWLATASPKSLTEYCRDLRNAPLAIRWFVLGLAAGVDPNARLREQDELLSFCVDSVWSGLSETARSICKYLAAMVGRSAKFSELVVFVDEPADAVRRTIHELQRRALVGMTLEEGPGQWIENVVSLTETAAAYVVAIQPVTRRERERARRNRSELEKREAQIRARSKRVDLSPTSAYIPDDLGDC